MFQSIIVEKEEKRLPLKKEEERKTNLSIN
jgi:hypothetical protein